MSLELQRFLTLDTEVRSGRRRPEVEDSGSPKGAAGDRAEEHNGWGFSTLLADGGLVPRTSSVVRFPVTCKANTQCHV